MGFGFLFGFLFLKAGGEEQIILVCQLFNLKDAITILFIWEYERIEVTGHLVFTMQCRIN